jgi:dolichyl-diphosphooligosaccharide---protein glycosyltransferase
MAGSKNSRSSSTMTAADPTAVGSLVQAVVVVGLLNVMYYICREAYTIRLYAINEFGRIIHEFDPYFNYRATEVWMMNGIWVFFVLAVA